MPPKDRAEKAPAPAKKPRAIKGGDGAGPAQDAAARLQAEEQERLRERCFGSGVVCKTKRLDAEASGTGLPKKVDGMDVVKRSSLRKNRYLLNLPVLLEGITGGKMGALAQLDTQTPVLYLDFPAGRVKLRGSMLFPRNKYLSLRLGQGKAVCEDVFDSMIVFSDYCWIGRKEDNPEEHPLPMPATLQQATPAPVKGTQQTARSSQPEPDAAKEGGSQPVRQSQRSVQKRRYAELSDDDSAADSSDADSDEGEAAGAEARGSSREGSGPHAEQPAGAATPAGQKRRKTGAKGTLLSFYQRQPAAGGSKEGSAEPGGGAASGEESEPVQLSSPESGRRSQPKRAARGRPSLPIVLEDSDEDSDGGSDGDAGSSAEGSADSDFAA